MFVRLYKYLVNTRYTIQNRVAKGQIKPKAVWARRRFFQKTNGRHCFVCCEKKKKQTKQICSFIFWENLRHVNLLSVLSDLLKIMKFTT